MTTASSRKDNVREHITKLHRNLLDLVRNLGSSNLDFPLYCNRASSIWYIRSAITHLTAAALAMLHNARAIAGGNDRLPPHFDLNRWNQNSVKQASNVPIDALLSKLERIHENWLHFLEEIPESHLSNPRHHALGDVITVEGFMRRSAKHQSHDGNEIGILFRCRYKQPRKPN